MIDLFSTAKGNANVLRFLLKSLNVKVTQSTVYSCLHEHQDYPSLLSFSDCLKTWKIPNGAYRIAKEEYDPADLSFPLLAHVEGTRPKFIVVHNIAEDRVIYSDERHNQRTMREAEFLEQWDGVVVHAEPAAGSGEKGYRQQRAKALLDGLRIPGLVAFAVLTATWLLLQQEPTWAYCGLMLATAMGLTISVLLLVHSIDANNPLLQNLCSLGRKNNCNAILKSDSAKVTGWLSWSEVGFFYFTGFLLSLLLVDGALPVLALVNLCCLPYTLWSIWYQYKARNWCVLCCAVQVKLWLQFTFFATSMGYAMPALTLQIVIGLAACFMAPVLLWAFVKPFMLRAGEVSPLRKQVNKFKYNPELFNQLLARQVRHDVPDDIMPIVLGNKISPMPLPS